MKCPFCGSANIRKLPSSEQITEQYVDTIRGGVTITREKPLTYQVSKGVCFECGGVFKKLDDDVLEKYKKDRQYFGK